MVGLVLHHRAEPFLGRDRGSRRRDALAGKLLRREGAKDTQRFGMLAVVVGEDRREATGELGVMARVAAGMSLHVLAVHVPLDAGQVADDVTQGPPPLCRRPLNLDRKSTRL